MLPRSEPVGPASISGFSATGRRHHRSLDEGQVVGNIRKWILDLVTWATYIFDA